MIDWVSTLPHSLTSLRSIRFILSYISVVKSEEDELCIDFFSFSLSHSILIQ